MPPRELGCPDTGFAAIDEDHWRLTGLIRELVEYVSKGQVGSAKECLSTTLEHVVAHFALEERLMAESHYVNLARHKEAHDAFVADAQKFAKELATKGITPNFRRWAVGRLLEWFQLHIVTNDIVLAKHLIALKHQR